MAKETNEILGHGDEADGIEEYDNPLPDWWLGLFILCIVYGIGYTINYHFISHDSQEKRYLAQMAEAEIRWPTPEGPASFTITDELVAEGEGVFAQTCASCHNANLTGGIGPNLIDDTWIHGNAPEQVLATVTNGVSDKGMPAWGPVLGPKKVQAVTAFVLSKQGSAPATDPTHATTGEGQGGDAAASGEGSGDAAQLPDGPTIYATNCAACHGPEMKGLVGPNLTDAEWIHGGDIDSIKHTITNGVPEKGMVAWGPILGEAQIDIVARYVQSQGAGLQD
ncbi:MAG: c-type cytochrome [Alphaproteobacteria bacterium]|nr:c-type cytochrome [Alphaproteobacteria bacterium]